MANRTFYNNYHFVPLSSYGSEERLGMDAGTFRENGPGIDSHYRYGEGLHSGRLVCMLEAETPLVVGGNIQNGTKADAREGKPATYGRVRPFLLNGQPALPATSLKGLISSIAEAASGSALRVFYETTEVPKPPKRQSSEAPTTTIGDFAKANAGPEILPYSKDRTRISIAERMFGFVESDKKDDRGAKGKNRTAFAGKLRFSHGLLGPEFEADKVLGPSVPLKILSSPEPYTPALYFRHRGNGAGPIPKNRVSPDQHDLQGRKMYLHHDAPAQAEPWHTKVRHDESARDLKKADKTANQKNRVQPIKDGTRFWFHVDFDNLTDDELDLLCFALRPSADFRHKLGMGKPIGLGSVRIDPQGLFLIDRQQRYGAQALFGTGRYRAACADSDTDPAFSSHPDYEAEARTDRAPNGFGPQARAKRWRENFGGDGKPLAAEIGALLALGEHKFPAVGNEKTPWVHYPATDRQLARAEGGQLFALEIKGFEWSGANEKHAEKYSEAPDEYAFLAPIEDGEIKPVRATSDPPQDSGKGYSRYRGKGPYKGPKRRG